MTLLLTIAATVGTSRSTLGYVRYRSTSGASFAWKTSCVWLWVYPTNLPLLTKQETEDAMTAAIAVWRKQDPNVGACSYLDLRILVAPDNQPQPPARNDGANVVGFRRDTWCPKPPDCYDPAALALTTVSARTSTGEILDADIEFNAINFSWSDVTRSAPTGSEQDLQNALAHEMGHVIGLDHTCYFGNGDRPTDQNGDPIPDCTNAPAVVVETTMFPSANPLDTNKRTLAADDLMGVCGIYPLASDPMSCPPPAVPGSDAGSDAGPFDAAPGDVGDAESPSKNGGCGCEVYGPARTTPGALLAGILLVLVRRRRR